jgi:amino acid adenylation domain-containing protein/non-ribosomal peptide synthase protein (TIGR01720 family)
LTIDALLSELDARDVRIWVDGEKLRLDTPKGGLSPELKAELTARKAELIAHLRTEPQALSYSQQRLWFLDQLEGPNATYNVPLALRVDGPIDAAALERAVADMVERHQILSARFVTREDGQPAQVLEADRPIAVPIVDVSEAELDHRIQAEATRPFDLAAGPMLRVVLFRLGAERHVLFANMHHIVSDGWSMGVFSDELTACYLARAAGGTPDLRPLPLQYTDFARWQRRRLTGETLDAMVAFWRDQLAGLPPLLEVPTDRPRPAVMTHHGGHIPFAIDADLTRELRALSKREGCTLFMALMAGYATLLGRYSGQTDFAIGTTIANRTRAETEPLIGFFVNTLPLRMDLSGGVSFRELLARTRRVSLNAYEHQDLPFEHLVDALQPARNMSHTPFFQAMFMLQNMRFEETRLPGLAVRPLPLQTGTAHFDLNMALAETGDRLEGVFEYRTDLFDAATIERLIAHLKVLLAAVAKDPDRAIWSLPVLTELEHRRQVHDWNDTVRDFRVPDGIQALFEEQAARDPDRVAVVFDAVQMTYGDLNRRADRLARRLAAAGVGPEVRVGVYLDRSVEMLVAVLGTLKAGGAYVPLHHTWPERRIQQILSQIGLRHLVTRQTELEVAARLQATLPELTHLICLDETREFEDDDRSNVTIERSGPDHTAYIIFTSGSTGVPKGVIVRHRPVLNIIDWVNRRFGVGPGDRLLFVTSICFDLSVYDIFGILGSGGSIHIASSDDIADAERLASLLDQEPITFWDSAPAALDQLMSLVSTGPPDGARRALRLVQLSGDWIPVSLPDRIRAAFARAQVVSLGGATEAAIWSNFYEIDRVDPDWPSIPYGKPTQNARYYVLDDHLHPCPIGVAGELFIGGDCLAAGYTTARQTADRFIPDPFAIAPGRVMYRTGDRTRFHADGNIEILGRLDHQVKIRGYRIETGDVEAAINSHPGVEKALVMAREHPPGVRSLVAYVAANGGGPRPAAGEIQDHVREQLPAYMVPSAVVVLDELPVTANGKLDREALMRAAPESVESRRDETAPANEVEAALVAIWRDVLGLERVGTRDNFFDLGGDSIVSIQIITRARQAGLAIKTRQIFLHQTIAELAAVAMPLSSSPESERGATTGAVPLLPIQRRFFALDLPAPHHFNQSVLLSTPPGTSGDALAAAMEAVVAHHDALRLGFLRDDSGWGASLPPARDGDPAVLMVENLSHFDAAAQAACVEATAAVVQTGFHLNDGRRIQARFFDCGEGEAGRLLIVCHHLVIDAVSWRILLEDLQAAYHQIVRGERPALQPKTTSVFEWANRLNAHAASPQTLGELDYWRGLADLQPVRLAADSEPADTIADDVVASRVLSDAQTRRLRQDVPAVHNTQTNDALLSALARTLGDAGRSSTVLVEMEGHGREEIFDDLDVTRSVGWFTTIFPVALECDHAASPAESLRRTKERLRRIPARGLGYGLLKYLSDAADVRLVMDRVPAADVTFNYLGQLDTPAAAGWLTPAIESAGPPHDPRTPRRHVLDVSAFVRDGRMHVEFRGSGRRLPAGAIETWADRYVGELTALIDDCAGRAASYTPSDFPAVALSQEALDRILAAVAPAGRSTRLALDGIYRLTPSQQGMLFDSLAAPGSGVHVEQACWRLGGDLDVDAFRAACAYVTGRHAALRTAFVFDGVDEPVQVVLGEAPVLLDVEDWRTLDAPEQARRLGNTLRRERMRGFAAGKAPLSSFLIAHVDDGVQYLVWTFSHLLMDGWCMPLVQAEAMASYEAIRAGRQPALPPTAPFTTYLEWLARQDLDEAAAFWRRSLDGRTRATALGRRPSIAPASEPASSHGRFSQRTHRVPAAASAAIVDQARRRRLGFNDVMQALWSVLLRRYSNDADVLFGATVSGRPPELPGVDTMVGLFINTLPVRVDVRDEAAFWSLAADVQSRQIERRSYEYCSAGQVHRWADGAHGPLYYSLLVVENYPVGAASSASPSGLTPEQFEYHGAQTQHPFTLLVTPGPEIALHAVFDTRCIDEGSADRILDQLARLFTAVAAGDVAIGSLVASIADGDLPSFRPPQEVAGGAGRVYVAPRTDLELRLARIWTTLLGVPEIGVRDGFFELGGHSLLVLQLVQAIRAEFGRDLPLTAIFEAPTIEALAASIRESSARGAWSSLVAIQPHGAQPPIFCVHPLGGNVLCYADLARLLPPDQPLFGLQAPGMEEGQVPLTSIDEMATAYLRLVRERQPDGPYALAGYSFGGYVAFEMAQRLRDAGEGVALVALLDTPAPSVIRSEQRDTGSAELLSSLFPVLGLSVERLRALGSEDDQLAHVMARAREAYLVPPGFSMAEARRYFAVCRINHGMRPAPRPFAGKLTLLRARDGAERISTDPSLGWLALAPGGLDLHWVDGRHEDMLASPHAQSTARVIADTLASERAGVSV